MSPTYLDPSTAHDSDVWLWGRCSVDDQPAPQCPVCKACISPDPRDMQEHADGCWNAPVALFIGKMTALEKEILSKIYERCLVSRMDVTDVDRVHRPHIAAMITDGYLCSEELPVRGERIYWLTESGYVLARILHRQERRHA